MSKIVLENLNASFELLRKRHPFTGLNITEQERIEIVKALGTHVTKWYKCSKGKKIDHFIR